MQYGLLGQVGYVHKTAANVGLVVNELVTNALRHGVSANAGNIRISGEARSGRIWIAVEDDGKGLTTDFDPAKSHGLGMRLSLLLVSAFGSQLSWANTGQGARFAFDLPVDGA